MLGDIRDWRNWLAGLGVSELGRKMRSDPQLDVSQTIRSTRQIYKQNTNIPSSCSVSKFCIASTVPNNEHLGRVNALRPVSADMISVIGFEPVPVFTRYRFYAASSVPLQLGYVSRVRRN